MHKRTRKKCGGGVAGKRGQQNFDRNSAVAEADRLRGLSRVQRTRQLSASTTAAIFVS
jgi:hypothetical protein